MLNILFVVSKMAIGGPQKSLVALLDRLDYSRVSVSVLALHPGGPLERFLNPKVRLLTTPSLITAYTLPSDRIVWALRALLSAGRWRASISVAWGLAWRIAMRRNINQFRQRFWRAHRGDVPVLDGSFDAAFGILGLSTYCVADCVSARQTYHWVRSDTRILGREQAIDAEYYSQLTGALSVSEECARIFEAMYPDMVGKVSVFHNYLPVGLYSRIAPPPILADGYQTPQIISVGRLDKLKGMDLILDTASELTRRGRAYRWYIAGDGPERQRVETEITRRGLGNNVTLLGFQLNTMGLLRQCDCFVHASRTEGKSNAVDEALFVGCPVIVTNYPTVGDQVENGVSGLICEMNGTSIADAIEQSLDDPSLRERLASHRKGHEDAPSDPSGFLIDLVNRASR